MHEDGLAVRVENLSKRYRLGRTMLRQSTLRDEVAGALQGLARRRWMHEADERILWALKDVSIEVGWGEVVGLVGHNGAGKSTLLKILSRISEPTSGRAEIYGRVGSLLEAGVGFHTELTGRENVFLSGAILGMPKAEIQRKFDEIVAFAELERFIDTSVKHYSSGMQVRLGFAVAAHLEPDILILDELLAVGDAAFQRSCIAKLSELAQSGRAVLFASHYMTALSNFCTRAYRLDRGTIVDSGSASGVIKRYLDQGRPNQQDLSHLPRHRPDFQVLLHTVRVCQDGETVLTFTTGGPFGLEVECRADPEAHPLLGLGFRISSNSGTYIFGSDAGEYGALHPNRSGRVLFRARLDHLVLSPGTYTVSLFLGNGRYILDAVENAASFDVVWAPRPDIPFPPNEWPPVFLPVCWESQELSEPGEDR